jgi:hypothetical protein
MYAIMLPFASSTVPGRWLHFCEVGTEFLNIIYVNFMLERGKWTIVFAFLSV